MVSYQIDNTLIQHICKIYIIGWESNRYTWFITEYENCWYYKCWLIFFVYIKIGYCSCNYCYLNGKSIHKEDTSFKTIVFLPTVDIQLKNHKFHCIGDFSDAKRAINQNIGV